MEKHLKNIGELELDERTDLPRLLKDTLGQVFNKILKLIIAQILVLISESEIQI